MDINKLQYDKEYCNHLLGIIQTFIKEQKTISSYETDDDLEIIHELIIDKYDQDSYFDITYCDSSTNSNWESLYATYNFVNQGKNEYGNLRIRVDSDNPLLYNIQFLPHCSEIDVNINVPFYVDPSKFSNFMEEFEELVFSRFVFSVSITKDVIENEMSKFVLMNN